MTFVIAVIECCHLAVLSYRNKKAAPAQSESRKSRKEENSYRQALNAYNAFPGDRPGHSVLVEPVITLIAPER